MTTIRDIAHDVQRDNPQLGSKGDVESAIKATLGCILQRVAAGEKVNLRGFGVFSSRLYKGRKLNSPLMEGGEITFNDQYVLRFKQSSQAKKVINGIVADDPKAAKAAKKAAKASGKKGGAKKASKKGGGKKGGKPKASAPEAADAAE